MRSVFNKALAWLVDQGLCLLVSFVTGIRPHAAGQMDVPPGKTVYFANHGSHGDFVLVWVSLPRRWRKRVRPVAGADYWLGSRLRRFIAQDVFNALLIDRQGHDPQAVIGQMTEALEAGDALIIFPEGTRNTDENTVLLPFKSGIYHLAQQNPQTEFVPVWINNINRVLPKGKFLPVPLLCDVSMGGALSLEDNEDKHHFIQRSRQALLALAPPEQQAKDTAAQEAGA
ncbi:1-acyl-sn-glycerol-3-phosphate acyltransferase [Neisseria sp. HSC-16F19]|nr:lysophospholipid acyltransferase family protein [Neisseria sp. HSC-16F19]MCP2039437.1 1-acyl-sn-glycerol-3-phosphate acyltransferase [Neisseria sp. HSC-16F19]